MPKFGTEARNSKGTGRFERRILQMVKISDEDHHIGLAAGLDAER
jgi:hypothetical protein